MLVSRVSIGSSASTAFLVICTRCSSDIVCHAVVELKLEQVYAQAYDVKVSRVSSLLCFSGVLTMALS